MAKRFTTASIPLWLAIILMAVAVGIATAVSIYFREVVYKSDVLLTREGVVAEKLEYGSWPVLSNADFFASVKNDFIASGSDFVEANLSEMKLRVYEKGILAGEFEILSKGKEGSWWETPAGLYKVETKERDHFSSFGRVYQPWSMAFQGNFFIHGWPYYPGGKPVKSTYSGGCIRLSTEDAEKIYDMVEVGTPIMVFEEDFAPDGLKYEVKKPELSAEHYLAADLRNNFVFLDKFEGARQVPVASLTKLMTALVATEYINLEKEITITKEMIVPTSKPRLKAGQKITVFQLLYPLLMESSNETAVALAKPLGEKYFVSLMNQKAEALGMKSTKFVDVSGASAENVSSIEDLFALAKYLYNNRSFILKVSAGDLEWSVYGSPAWGELKNFNIFSEDLEFAGGKIGFTEEAKNTMLAIFEIEVAGVKRPVAVIVLGSDNLASDIRILLNYIKAGYESTND